MIDQFDNTTKLPPFINTNDPEFLITDAGTPKIDGNKIHIEALAHQVTFIPPPSAKTQEFCSDLEPRDYPATYALNERVEAELNLRTHGDGNAPVRLVAHLFPLGKLTEGTYKFHVHSRGKLLTKMPLEVEVTPPQVVLITKNIGELKEFYRFKINFQSQTGLNITSIRSARSPPSG